MDRFEWLGLVRLTSSLSVRDVLSAVEAGSAGTAVIVEDDGSLVGVCSDGDLRRALLSGVTLESRAEDLIQRSPVIVDSDTSRVAVLDLFRAYEISAIPIVDSGRVVVGIHLLKEIIGKTPRNNVCVILAGGRGSRLGSVTNDLPKPMLKIAGRPVLERIILHLMGFGFSRFVVSIGYLGETITSYFGNGERMGCQISYVSDPDGRPLGTGGPLSLVGEHVDSIDSPVIVLNGDLVTDADIPSMLTHHHQSRASLTMAIRDVQSTIQFGVVHLGDEGHVLSLDEKPVSFHQVNAGIYVVSPEVIVGLEKGRSFAMTDMIREVLERGERVSSWRVASEWIDVGTPHDLERARGGAA